MTRTESKTMKVHPDNEQSTIDVMQRFHWSLANSQDVKNQTSYLKRDGENLVQVKETEHFVNLMFSRDMDTPNLARLKALEAEYLGAVLPEKPGLTMPFVMGAIFLFVAFGALSDGSYSTGVVGLGLAGGCFWWLKRNIQKGKDADELTGNLVRRKQQILEECDSL
jgi:hypothetical protein